MSKLYDIYTSLKENEKDGNNTLYLFKSGMFFIFIDRDALVASKLLNLKLTSLSPSIVKCGFPISSLDKFTMLLKNSGYSIKIIDNTANLSYNIKDYEINSSVENLLFSISNINLDSLSVSEAFAFLEKIKNDVNSILVKRGGNMLGPKLAYSISNEAKGISL